MAEPKLQATGRDSFYGDYLYDRIIPQDHFLRHLRELVSWRRFTYRLLKYYRGQGKVGRPPIDPAVVLKMLLLSYLYDLSERQVEEFCNLNLAAKYFLGLAIDAPAPDHTTLTVFKNRILENGKLRAYERMLAQIIQEAREVGIKFGPVQLVDSTHSIADVNVAKDDKRGGDGEGPRDPDARWGCKGTYTVRDEEGKKQKRRKMFYGFKLHGSMNVGAQMISSLIVSTGNRPDGHYLPNLIERDLKQGIPIKVCAADRAYDDTDNHLFLQELGIGNALRLNRYRTQKKDGNRQVWVRLKEQPWYDEALGLRYQIERKFGEAKRHHDLGRCRYLSLQRYAVQAYLTVIALNLKQLVRGLTGVSLRGPTLIRT
jgi:IS5 family transposase